jgi:predicted ATPase/DNA-binding CsgD family transcriptional regulator
VDVSAGRETNRRLGNLAVETTSFVGRRKEVAETRRLLCSARLVTLTGVGGVGKTRLALRVADQVGRSFTEGICVVELAGLREPELLPLTVMQALGLRNRSTRNPVDVLADYLQDRQFLLVLDSCEHLVPACAELVYTLLRAAPRLRVLATSRQQLGMIGEHVLVVPPLSTTDGTDASGDGGGTGISEAMTLFAERAASATGFAVTAENRESVAQLCQRLDGLPLAIELAAVRLRALPVDVILRRLDDRFGLLTHGNPSAVPRQQTLRATTDWSFDLCSPGERLLWQRLSVFPSSFDLAAMEDVCTDAELPADTALEQLSGLIDKSVLARDVGVVEARYHMLDTVRQYGCERLCDRGETTALRRRHRDHYLRLAERAEREWLGPDQMRWGERIRTEQANLWAALTLSITEPGAALVGLRLAGKLWFSWIACGNLPEGRYWLDRALTAGTAPSPERATALWVNGWVAALQGDNTAADIMLAQCRGLARRLGDDIALAHAVQHEGQAAWLRGDLPRAAMLLEEAVARHEAADTGGAAALRALPHLAATHCLRGDIPRALDLCRRCRAMCEQIGERWTLSFVLWILGLAHWMEGDLEEAAAHVRDGLRMKQEFNDRVGIALSLELLAWIAATGGAPERAAGLLGSGHTIWRSMGRPLLGFEVYADFHRACQARMREALGDARYRAGFEAGARRTLDEAVDAILAEETVLQPTTDPPARTTAPVSLTKREWQVAELVSQGLSNREIAYELLIALRTVDGHVEHILGKLGFTNRTQIASWIATRRIPQA